MPDTSKIELIHGSCTDQNVDAVVNAANDGLWAGGGICGVIFRKAGMSELQAACSKYKTPLNDGDAVITPAFKMTNAKKIIHAVGPDFGCKKNAFSELFDAYYNSLCVLMENNLHSISFPLISAGIFGGNLPNPAYESAKQCFRAYRKFVQDNPDYFVDVKLCAFSDREMQSAMKIFEGTSGKADILKFHLVSEENGYLSNWYLRDFVIKGKKYCCVEQYMMEQKALLFGDTETASRIMQTSDQREIKQLGREASGFNEVLWDGNKQLIVYRGVRAKFEQNSDLRSRLISTGDAIPVECSRSDKIWGIGLGMDDPDVYEMDKWKGQNLLGFIILQVRDEMR